MRLPCLLSHIYHSPRAGSFCCRVLTAPLPPLPFPRAAALSGAANPAGRLTHTWYTPEGLEAIGGITDYRMHPDPGSSGKGGRNERLARGLHPCVVPFHPPAPARPRAPAPAPSHTAAGYPGRTYRYTTAPVLLPFGYGLSYSSWRYGDLTVTPAAPRPCDDVAVSVTLYNDSPVDGSEVVQARRPLRLGDGGREG